MKIYRDPVSGEGSKPIYIGDALFVDGARTDIETAYPGYPFNYKAGWGYMLLTNFLPNSGNGTFKLYAIATDKEGNQTTLGSKTITCDNAHATKPFGAIDTPARVAPPRVRVYYNFGWALTPQPSQIATDGSTISVYMSTASPSAIRPTTPTAPISPPCSPAMPTATAPAGFMPSTPPNMPTGFIRFSGSSPTTTVMPTVSVPGSSPFRTQASSAGCRGVVGDPPRFRREIGDGRQ